MVIVFCLCEWLGRPILSLYVRYMCVILLFTRCCILSPITFENLISRILVSVDFKRLTVFYKFFFTSKSPTFGWISYIPENTFLHIPSRQIHSLSDAVSLFHSDTILLYSFYVFSVFTFGIHESPSCNTKLNYNSLKLKNPILLLLLITLFNWLLN